MKKYMLIIPILWMILPLTISAQVSTSNLLDESEQYAHNPELQDYFKEMQLYIMDNSAEPMPKELKNFIAHYKEDYKREGMEFTKKDLAMTINDYWKDQFILNNPNPAEQSILRTETTICENGGFENDFTYYSRYKGKFNNHWEKCDPVFGNNPVNWQYLAPAFNYPNDHPFDFAIQNPGEDPIIPDSFGFDKVKFGDHSLRINNTKDKSHTECGRGKKGINKLTKDFNVDASHSKFGIWYSCVLQDPNNHYNPISQDNDKPYFNIQFLDEEGYTVDELCWDSTEDFFFDIVDELADCGSLYSSDTVKFQPWRCSIFDLTPYSGQNLTMEIITADCGQGAHFGYSYIDGICESCATIDLFFADGGDCDALQVCGSYDLANGENTSLELESMVAILTGDDGSSVSFPVTDIDQDLNTFCIDIPDGLIDVDVCYDIRVVGTFDDNVNDPFEITSATVINGQLNDFCGSEYFEKTPIEYVLIDASCNDNGTKSYLNDDTFTFTIQVLSPAGIPWSVVNNTYYTLASGTTTQTLTLGPFNYQDCYSLAVVNDLSNIFNFIDLDIPAICSGCTNSFKVCDYQIDCDDNGTLQNPFDDTWSFTFMAEGPDGGTFFVNDILNFIGFYNTVYTFDMGLVSTYGGSHTFEIIDLNTNCYLLYTVEVPEGCKNCLSEYEIIYGQCEDDPCSNSQIYEVSILADPPILDCIASICIVLDDYDCIPLEFPPVISPFPNPPVLSLGYFYIQDGPFTIIITDCDGCQQELTIWPPDCDDSKPGQGGGGPIFDTGGYVEIENDDDFEFQFHPIPTTDILEFETNMIDDQFEIHIYNTYGQEVGTYKNLIGNQKLNISEFKTGVYMVTITSKNKLIHTDRIIKI